MRVINESLKLRTDEVMGVMTTDSGLVVGAYMREPLRATTSMNLQEQQYHKCTPGIWYITGAIVIVNRTKYW